MMEKNVEKRDSQLADMRLQIPANRNVLMDTLRAGAILYIVGFWHLCGYSEKLDIHSEITEFITYSALGLFCFISGFLLSQRYTILNSNDIIRFYRKRAFRIYPMYFISLTGFLLFGFVDFRTYWKSVLLANMILNQGLLTLWFITMLTMFYLIAPIYLKSYGVMKTIFVTVSLYLLLVLFHMKTGRIDLRFPQYLPLFAAGILAARSESIMRVLEKRVVVVVGFLLFLIVVMITKNLTAAIPRMLFTDIAIFSVLPIFFKMGGILSNVLNRKIIYILSYASFAIYLLHRIIFEIGVMIYQPITLTISIIYLAGVVLSVTIVISYGVQKLYDVLLNRLQPGLN